MAKWDYLASFLQYTKTQNKITTGKFSFNSIQTTNSVASFLNAAHEYITFALKAISRAPNDNDFSFYVQQLSSALADTLIPSELSTADFENTLKSFFVKAYNDTSPNDAEFNNKLSDIETYFFMIFKQLPKVLRKEFVKVHAPNAMQAYENLVKKNQYFFGF